MGTNFYFITKNRELVHEHFAEKYDFDDGSYSIGSKEYELLDIPDFHYEIHLNKLSCGWRPLFQNHKCFRSFAELEQFYNDHASDLIIQDEYGDEYSFENYKKRIVNHSHADAEPVKWVYEEDKLCGYPGRKYLRTKKCEPEEAELWTPFDHIEYGETQKAARERLKCWSEYILMDFKERYHRDPDYKFDWVDGEFS